MVSAHIFRAQSGDFSHSHKRGFLHLCSIDIWGWIILCRGAVLFIVGCLAASLTSTYWMPGAHLSLPFVVIRNVSRLGRVSSVRQHPLCGGLLG